MLVAPPLISPPSTLVIVLFGLGARKGRAKKAGGPGGRGRTPKFAHAP